MVLRVFSVRERVVKVGKRLHTSQEHSGSAWKRERGTERKSEVQKQIVWEKTRRRDKESRKHIRSLKRCRETRIRKCRRKTAVSFTDRLMDRGLVNVSEGERLSVNHLWPSQLAWSRMCVCVWWYNPLQTPVTSDTTGNMIHTMYSWPFPHNAYVGNSLIHILTYYTT